MKTIQKTIILALALMLGMAQGAWAQTALTPNDADNKVWTTTMPTYDIMLQAEYYTDLLDNADNSAWLTENDGQTADIWLGRTLQPGSYNTLALPFAMTLADFKTATGDDDILVKQLSEASLEGNTLTLNFTDAASIAANTPYLVKLSGSDPVKLEGFDGVTVSTTDGTATFDGVVSFIPTLGKTQVTTAKERILFLGASNTLLHPSADNQSINGFRAYFQLPAAAAGVRAFNLNFGDEVATGIISVQGSGSMVNGSDEWYTLQGIKLSDKPTEKGI